MIGEDNGTPLQYSCLENPMDRGAWKAAVHGVAEGQTWLSDFAFTFHCYALKKEMAAHSGVLAWRIPGLGEPGGLPSLGSHRVWHNWSDLAAVAAAGLWCLLERRTFHRSVPLCCLFSLVWSLLHLIFVLSLFLLINICIIYLNPSFYFQPITSYLWLISVDSIWNK